ncbi:hypothetical protein B4099_1372 [Heyndrickxia coagulans]|uniref:Uncharacterized protein n=1 Tax=Heyndrickxia coagulans TaxID=1398 RepID=A0A150KEG0_HEYCO|nr:hypothetical protein B4099_1372 [Heyndrickxia coagulans]
MPVRTKKEQKGTAHETEARPCGIRAALRKRLPAKLPFRNCIGRMAHLPYIPGGAFLPEK